MERHRIQPPCKRFRRLAKVKQRAEDGHSQSADGDQSHFDFSAGEIACGHATESDADTHSGLQIASARVVNVQNVVAIHDDSELQQCRQKPKIGVAHHGPEEHAAGVNRFYLRVEFTERIPPKYSVRVSGGQARDSEAREQSETRKTEKQK